MPVSNSSARSTCVGRAQFDRILASPTFTDAGRARKFLQSIVENALAGRRKEIKESVIAVEAFGRSPQFDPRSDPIVRVEAGRLRTKLLSYYHSEGSNDAILIELPKGGYVPQFPVTGDKPTYREEFELKVRQHRSTSYRQIHRPPRRFTLVYKSGLYKAL